MKSVETRIDLDTLPEAPEIHLGVDFTRWPFGRFDRWWERASCLGAVAGFADHLNSINGGSVPER
jgi:hypothetical protein